MFNYEKIFVISIECKKCTVYIHIIVLYIIVLFIYTFCQYNRSPISNARTCTLILNVLKYDLFHQHSKEFEPPSPKKKKKVRQFTTMGLPSKAPSLFETMSHINYYVLVLTSNQ